MSTVEGTSPDLDVWQRRGLLDAGTNPARALDYAAELEATLSIASLGQTVTLRIRYVPDMLILPPENLDRYLGHVAKLTLTSLEELASLVLMDISNELVGRWTQVRVTGEQQSGHLNGHQVLIEDRQPDWTNDALIAQLSS